MDHERAMISGIVPVRPPSYLPGVVKLPRRYEKAAVGDPKTARFRKVSVCGEPLHMRQGISARLDDLMTAIMWVKQELILLRQHDILLKRQFFDIHDSIVCLKTPPKKLLLASCNSMSNSFSVSCDSDYGPTTSPSSPCCPSSHHPLSSSLSATAMSRLARTPSSISLSSNSSPASSPFINKRNNNNSNNSNNDSHKHSDGNHLPNGFNKSTSGCISLPGFDPLLLVRPSSSATVLNHSNGRDSDGDSDDTDGDDTFDDQFFRPRTSSMKTSRDLAALARRRGSKELI